MTHSLQNTPVQIENQPAAGSYWLAALHVREGQAVQAGQALARLEYEGTARNIKSPRDGYIVGLHAQPGQTITAPAVLCYICEQPSLAAEPTAPQPHIETQPLDPAALLIFGGGGHGKTVIDLVRAMRTYRIVGVLDDGLPPGSEVLGAPVLGGAADLPEWYRRGIGMAVNAVGGIGNAPLRARIFDMLRKEGFTFPTLVHPSAVVEHSAQLEAGVQVFAHAYVGSAARVGFGTVINTSAIVHHDCVIGKIVNLSPGATLAGNVRVEDQAQIGMLATVNLKVKIGAGARLGNGCTVKADVPAGRRVYAGAVWPEPRPRK